MSGEDRCENWSDAIAHLTEMVCEGYKAKINEAGCIMIISPLGRELPVPGAIYYHITGQSPEGAYLYTRAKEIGMSESFARQLQDSGHGGVACSRAFSAGLRREILETFEIEEIPQVA